MTAQAGAILNTSSAWDAVDWRTTEGNVRRLQARIVKAVQQKKWNKVKALQHLLTHSASGKLLAVRRVTGNDGRKTPGVDGELWDTPHKKLQGVISLTARGYRPMPMRRIYIPKANGKLRPLGIRLQARLRTTRWLPRKTSILRYDLWHTAGRNHIACLWGWAHARHRRKGAGWIKQKYFDRVGTRDWWFFGHCGRAGLASSCSLVSRSFCANRKACEGSVRPESLRPELDSVSVQTLRRRSASCAFMI
jgi:hypothetical protein